MAATDVVHVDVMSEHDDGLLVPFGQPSSSVALFEEENEKQNLFEQPPQNPPAKQRSSRLGRLFSRRSQSNAKHRQEFKENKSEGEDTRNEKVELKATTFAFPNAPCVVADQVYDSDEEERARQRALDRQKERERKAKMASIQRTSKKATDDSEKSESSSEESSDSDSDSDDDDDSEEEQEVQDKHRVQNHQEWQPQNNPHDASVEWNNDDYLSRYDYDETQRQWKVEGFGSQPIPDDDSNNNKSSYIGRFLRRVTGSSSSDVQRERHDMKTMRVATENTKDEKTLTEKISKAALVVMVPELYGEDDDGDDNLGMYRTISMTADEDLPQTQVSQHNDYAAEIQQMKKTISQLEKRLKSAELEANSWKLRAKELEGLLRQSNGQNEDDSSTGSLVNRVIGNSKEDDGIEWATNNTNGIEDDLLDMTTTLEVKPRQSADLFVVTPSVAVSEEEQTTRIHTDLLSVDQNSESTAKEKQVFDPLCKVPSQPDSSDTLLDLMTDVPTIPDACQPPQDLSDPPESGTPPKNAPLTLSLQGPSGGISNTMVQSLGPSGLPPSGTDAYPQMPPLVTKSAPVEPEIPSTPMPSMPPPPPPLEPEVQPSTLLSDSSLPAWSESTPPAQPPTASFITPESCLAMSAEVSTQLDVDADGQNFSNESPKEEATEGDQSEFECAVPETVCKDVELTDDELKDHQAQSPGEDAFVEPYVGGDLVDQSTESATHTVVEDIQSPCSDGIPRNEEAQNDQDEVHVEENESAMVSEEALSPLES